MSYRFTRVYFGKEIDYYQETWGYKQCVHCEGKWIEQIDIMKPMEFNKRKFKPIRNCKFVDA